MMVEEPTTTWLLAEPVPVETMPFDVLAATAADVVILVVIEEPAESVVVTSIVVGTVDVGACDVSSVVCAVFDVGVDSRLVGVGDALVGSVVGDAVVGVVSCVSLVGDADSAEAIVVLIFTPVPTICLFCGMMPAGMSSARTWAKPRLNRASILAWGNGR